MISFKAFHYNLSEILRRRGLEKNDKVQRFIDSECLRLSDPKTPKDTGALIQSGAINTKVGSGEVRWSTPYARRVYYNPGYNFSQSPERGAYWFERMKQQHKDQILKGATQIAGGRNK